MWWNILQENDQHFDIWSDRGPHIPARSSEELERQLSRNGITDELYREVLRQLEATGTARVQVNLGKFSQM